MTGIKTTEKIENLTEKELDKVSGGYPGLENFGEKSYKEAGIRWEHNVLSEDKYIIMVNGKEKNITRKEAEKIALEYHGKYDPVPYQGADFR